jgi:hypothetical protein
MDARTLEKEWEIITGLLPAGWRELARSTGALQRARQIRDPGALLQLILLHVGAGLSLRQAAARAKRTGLAEISDVGLLKRLRRAGPWLQTLAARMFAKSRFRSSLPDLARRRRIRAVDATHVREPGSTGTNWRVHYVLGLPSLECDHFEITGPSGGETYKRIPVEPGDIILGDRGYCHREGVAFVVEAGADVVVRLNATSFPLLDTRNRGLDLLVTLRGIPTHEPAEWPVRFQAGGKSYAGRLCGIRNSTEAAERAKRRLTKIATKKQKQLSPETLELAEYIYVFTTLPPTVSCVAVLELYRVRWQVELAFKRIKSLFAAGHVPKYDPESARAWMHAKLLAALLIERLSEEARFFSPWGYELTRP